MIYYIYKNCDLVYKCKTWKHARRKYIRIRKKSNLRHDLLELMTKKYLLQYD